MQIVLPNANALLGIQSSWSLIHKFGRNADIDTNSDPEDVWDAGGAYPWPTAAAAMTIVSASSDDDSDGTGARTVRLFGLDADFAEIQEDVTLNGEDAVTLANSYYRIHRGFALTAGSGGVNAGALTIAQAGTTVAQIGAGNGQTLMAIYTIPSGYSASYMAKWYVHALKPTAATQTVECKLFARPNGGAWQLKEYIRLLNNGAPYEYQYPFWLAYAAGTDLRIEGSEVSANDMEVSGGFDIIHVI